MANVSKYVLTVGNENNTYTPEYITITYSQGLTFTINGYDTCYVSGIGICTDSDINIPPISPNGNSVTSIGDYAFCYCTSLTSVTIPDSVTSIGDYAFSGCSKLVEVYNLSSLEITKGSWDNGYVGGYALNVYTPTSGESKLHTTDDGYIFYADGETVYLVAYIGSETELTLPSDYDGSDYEIYKYAFYYCRSLTSVTIGDSVTSIDGYAFYWCNSLTSITIPDSVTSIGNSAFRCCSSLVSITIPDSVTSIGEWAFSDCRSLESITIPESVTSIGYSAFYDCSSLTSVTIGDSVTSIGEHAFDDCESLTSITIPDSVTSIGTYAFSDCTSLKSVTIGDSVTSIGDYAFSSCESLASITIPEGVTSIGDGTFNSCSSLTSITIPEGVTSIDYRAFYSCSSLTSITIHDSITWIFPEAFIGCESLENIFYYGTAAQWNKIGVSIDNEALGNATLYCWGDINSSQTAVAADLYSKLFTDAILSSDSITQMLEEILSTDEKFQRGLVAWEANSIVADITSFKTGDITRKDLYKLTIYDLLCGKDMVTDDIYDILTDTNAGFMRQLIEKLALDGVNLYEITSENIYGDTLKVEFGLGDVVDVIFKSKDNLNDALEACAQYMTFSAMSSRFQTILLEMANDYSNPLPLRQAAKECAEHYKTATVDIISDMIEEANNTSTIKAIHDKMVDKIWEYTMKACFPGIDIIASAAKGIKFLGDVAFNLSNIYSSYYTLCVGANFEKALYNVAAYTYKFDYLEAENLEQAQQYLYTIKTYQNMIFLGCDYSINMLRNLAANNAVYNDIADNLEKTKATKQEAYSSVDDKIINYYNTIYKQNQ